MSEFSIIGLWMFNVFFGVPEQEGRDEKQVEWKVSSAYALCLNVVHFGH